MDPQTIIITVKFIGMTRKAFKTLQKEPSKELSNALRAFEDMRDNPNDMHSLQLARQYFHEAEHEESGEAERSHVVELKCGESGTETHQIEGVEGGSMVPLGQR